MIKDLVQDKFEQANIAIDDGSPIEKVEKEEEDYCGDYAENKHDDYDLINDSALYE